MAKDLQAAGERVLFQIELLDLAVTRLRVRTGNAMRAIRDAGKGAEAYRDAIEWESFVKDAAGQLWQAIEGLPRE